MIAFLSVQSVLLFVAVDSVELRVVVVRLGVDFVIIFEDLFLFLDVHHVVFFKILLRLPTAVGLVSALTRWHLNGVLLCLKRFMHN